MPKIIEVFGPSGVGKTTLYKSIQKDWSPENSWGVYHDIRYKRDPNLSFIQRVFNYLKRNLNRPRNEIAYKGYKPNHVAKERIFFNRYPEFSNKVVGIINEHCQTTFSGIDKRFINLYFMFESIEHFQAIRDLKSDQRTCLMDEGLLSRLMHLNSPSFSKETVDDYIKLMPLPDGVIYLQCSPDLIAKRAQKKNKTSSVHVNLREDEVVELTQKTRNLMNYALQEVEKRNITVHEINAERSIEKIKEDVIHILRGNKK